MRLTLRTLLAYLDDILEPEDAESIGKRIQESEVASALMHRIRDVMRRLRLEAPHVEENRGGLDPNTVAEYLDHVLPDDRVPDFERICLESDAHLAEVASCHQILALVLGEPAEVEPASREHMYALPQVAAELEAMEAQTLPKAAVGDGHGTAGPPPPPRRRPRPVVPDYLRDTHARRRRFPWIAAAILVVGAIGIGWIVVHRTTWFAARPATSVVQGTATGQSATEPNESQTAEPTTTEPAQPPEPRAVEPGVTPGEPSVTPPSVAQPAEVNKVAPLSATAPGGVEPQLPSEPAPQPGATEPALPSEPAPQPAAPTEEPAPAEEPTPAEPVTEAPRHVGRFVSDVAERQVLLQWDPDGGSWTRVPAQEVLVSGRDLLALPAFRPLVATTGLTIQLRGGTRVGLESAQGQETPHVTLKYGRMVVNTVGKPETRLPLDVGSRSGTLVFVDPESRVAIEMTRTLVPGADPEADPAAPIVDIYALSGQMVWESSDGLARIEFKTPSRLRLGPAGVGSAEPIEAFLPWVISGLASSLDRSAAKTLEEAVLVGRPVTLGLKEQLDHRKIEVRRLACRCLGFMGDFGPLVAGLDRAEQKPIWTWADHIDELRDALVRGPDVAAHVRSALDEAYGADGAKLYRMLWGYTAAQLIDGQDEELVKALSSELLAMRVVSFWNLNKITGLGLFYRPDDPSPRHQRTSIQAWEKRQASGEIRLKAAARGERGAPRAAAVGRGPSEEAAPPSVTVPSPPAGSDL